MNKKEKYSLWALSSVPLVMTLGNSMLIPVLPKIKKELEVSDFQITMIITMYSVAAILLIPIAGFLSDKWGRKKVIIPSLIIGGIGGIITGWASWKLSNPYMWIIIGRIVQGIGSAGALPVVIPCVGDMFKDEEKVSSGLGVVETANTFGKVLSPILGSVMASILWFLPFFAIPILCIIAIILIMMFIKTSNRKQGETSFKKFMKAIKKIFKNNGRWLFAIFSLGAIIMFILFGIQYYLSTILEDRYEIDGVWKGFILAIPLGFLSLVSYITGKKIGNKKVVMKRCITIGFFMIGSSFVISLFSSNIYFLLFNIAICGIGIGLSLPSLDALITEGIDREERGTITSLYSSMRFIGVAAGPPLFAQLMKGQSDYIFYLSILLGGIGVVLTILFIKPEKIQANK